MTEVVAIDVMGSDVRRALLIDVVAQLRDRRVLGDLLTAGLDPQLVDLLMNGLTLPELIILSDYRKPLFRIELYQAEVLRLMTLARRRNGDNATLEYLLRNGATKELIARWFTLSRLEVIDLRKKMRGLPRFPGKPRLPDTKTRDAIHMAWAALPDDLAERDRYLALHHSFQDMSIAALYQVVHEHDPQTPTVPTPSGLVGRHRTAARKTSLS
jgi:Protein of unknown function (DUF2857)